MKIDVSQLSLKNKFSPVDFNVFKNGCEQVINDNWKIQNYAVLDKEIVDLLIEYSKNGIKIAQFFKEQKGQGGSGTGYQYQTETICKKCGKREATILTKAKLLDFIKRGGVYTCPSCVKIAKDTEKLEKQLKREQEEKQSELRKQQNTENYINNYLNPVNSWNTSVKTHERYREISRCYINEDYVAEHIKSMEYKDFLLTPYWKAVAAEIKRKRNFQCQLCGSNKNLVVHHKTYEHHGYEHDYFVMQNDLIVLCNNCHSKFHDKVKD